MTKYVIFIEFFDFSAKFVSLQGHFFFSHFCKCIFEGPISGLLGSNFVETRSQLAHLVCDIKRPKRYQNDRNRKILKINSYFQKVASFEKCNMLWVMQCQYIETKIDVEVSVYCRITHQASWEVAKLQEHDPRLVKDTSLKHVNLPGGITTCGSPPAGVKLINRCQC